MDDEEEFYICAGCDTTRLDTSLPLGWKLVNGLKYCADCVEDVDQ